MLASPENTKVVAELELEAIVLELALIEPPDRRSIQGTTTCLPPLVDEEDNVLLLVGELEELVVPGSVEPEVPPETERMAKSMRPEDGLMIISLMAPRLCPEELVTWALLSCETRRCC